MFCEAENGDEQNQVATPQRKGQRPLSPLPEEKAGEPQDHKSAEDE